MHPSVQELHARAKGKGHRRARFVAASSRRRSRGLGPRDLYLLVRLALLVRLVRLAELLERGRPGIEHPLAGAVDPQQIHQISPRLCLLAMET